MARVPARAISAKVPKWWLGEYASVARLPTYSRTILVEVLLHYITSCKRRVDVLD